MTVRIKSLVAALRSRADRRVCERPGTDPTQFGYRNEPHRLVRTPGANTVTYRP